MDDSLHALSEFACHSNLADLDAGAVERARWVILDSLTAIGMGMREPEMKALLKTTLDQKSSGSGPCWVIGAGRRTHASDAALLNGTAGTWLELNEGCLLAKGHPGIQVVPAALAAAQELDSPGETLLRAVLMGYEISARVGRAAALRVAVHPHGTYGSVGAAVAVAVLRGFDAKAMRSVINIASTLGLGTSRKTLTEGATVRNIYSGHSGAMGLLAVRLAEAGVTGESNGLQSVYGGVLGERFDMASMTADLGSEWLISKGYFKLHCTGRYVHAAIDALEDALASEPGRRIAVRDIASIRVRAFKLATMLAGQEIDSSFGARFSIPFALATLIHHGGSSIEAFNDAAVAQPDIRWLARRVEVEEEPAFTQLYPQEQHCELRIEMQDGRTLVGRCEVMKGEAGNPYRNNEVQDKFMTLATQCWGAGTAKQLRDGFGRLEDIPAFGRFAEGFSL